MKRLWRILSVALLISTAFPSMIIVHHKIERIPHEQDFFFGVSFGLNTTREAKLLIDKVKDYTNLLVVNSWDVTTNHTALNLICDYAAKEGMHFMVFFDHISHIAYPWHLTWLDNAKERWGDKFLGIYLYDEPGGRQIEWGHWEEGFLIDNFANVSNYHEAADLFVTSIPATGSMQDLKERNIPAYTSDYALYWFDYQAGYDAVFAEFGWDHSRVKHIALCRGAAEMHNKDWGVIITWTYNHPPYLESGAQMLQDMITAYQSGAKYLIIFSHPRHPRSNPYGILTEEHFSAMKKFWNLIRASPKNLLKKVEGKTAFVLPEDYGWGMRSPEDKIWMPKWGPDELSPIIWNKMSSLIVQFGLRLDIVYRDPKFKVEEKYDNVYYWNSTGV